MDMLFSGSGGSRREPRDCSSRVGKDRAMKSHTHPGALSSRSRHPTRSVPLLWNRLRNNDEFCFTLSVPEFFLSYIWNLI